MKNQLKRLLFPGTNLHARQRYVLVPRYFTDEVSPGRKVLDIGCGNGMLSYAAWQRGALVRGITVKEKEVDGCRSIFNGMKKIPEGELLFERKSLRDLQERNMSFDAVICADVLEHIPDDRKACRKIWKLLSPGGYVHITVPNAEHPYNASFPFDRKGEGGHVRSGYTEEGLHSLVNSVGFSIERFIGYGGPIRQGFNWRIKEIQQKYGPVSGIPLFALALAFLPFDKRNPKNPFSFYAKIRRI